MAQQTLYYVRNMSVQQSNSTTVNTIWMVSSKQLLYHNQQNLLGTTEHGSVQNESSRCAIRRAMTLDHAQPCHLWVQHCSLSEGAEFDLQ